MIPDKYIKEAASYLFKCDPEKIQAECRFFSGKTEGLKEKYNTLYYVFDYNSNGGESSDFTLNTEGFQLKTKTSNFNSPVLCKSVTVERNVTFFYLILSIVG